MRTLLRDFRGQLSWGRVCSLVALIVAVIGQFRGMDLMHLQTWLAVALGNYGASKAVEMVCSRRETVLAGSCAGKPSADGDGQ